MITDGKGVIGTGAQVGEEHRPLGCWAGWEMPNSPAQGICTKYP